MLRLHHCNSSSFNFQNHSMQNAVYGANVMYGIQPFQKMYSLRKVKLKIKWPGRLEKTQI
jgi:hypothetical protein